MPVLSVALIAFATFVIVTVGAFRQEGVASADDPKSGTGGYALIAGIDRADHRRSQLPGRDALRSDSIHPIFSQCFPMSSSIARFRLRPG